MFIKANYVATCTTDLDLNKFKEDGIKGLILDLDNTIMRPKSGYFCDEIQAWLAKAKELGLKIIIVTNNKNEIYLRSIEPLLKQYELPMIIKAEKPRRKNLKIAIEFLGFEPHEVCVVGDRVLTDVLGGIRLGTKTAFVAPLLGKAERKLFRALRRIEKMFMS